MPSVHPIFHPPGAGSIPRFVPSVHPAFHLPGARSIPQFASSVYPAFHLPGARSTFRSAPGVHPVQIPSSILRLLCLVCLICYHPFPIHPYCNMFCDFFKCFLLKNEICFDIERSLWLFTSKGFFLFVCFGCILFFDHMNDFFRALCYAGAAAGTFCIVDVCNVVGYVDSVMFTVFLAQMASDTACGTCCHNFFSFSF